jgi:hypothetical protein
MDEFRDELQRCYGSVAYKRHTSLPGLQANGAEARRKRLTEELDDWLQSDQSRLTVEQAREIAMMELTEQSGSFELVGEQTEPRTRPDDHDD